ncbi:MAG: tRNA (cytidine(34)-2'-O)-methyltransferase [Bifidobacteriaceae bacterium]|jgi:tRNA (cytidine/uridine-2'-O-)-methyltransferase|nr:tRNA (cytidine(34)-2'-O)-methyltransferase [Bifidobacteriaceae bacterium]
MFHVVFFAPCIPQNTGNAIRLAAVTGVTLHLVEPLGFDLTDTKLRRSGLDYHDLAELQVHPDLEAALQAVGGQARVFAFTTKTDGLRHTDVAYQAGDVLLFGPEPDGLPEWVKAHPRVTAQVRIPMLPARRSLNLANSAAIAVYEAWRQHDFGGHH